tara:strand:- start:406 stop:1041 length:636 start_codon:yes stop_codon:yes gene_type:complete
MKFSLPSNNKILFIGFSVAIFLFCTTLSANITFQLDNVIEFNNSSFESHLLNNEKIVLKSKDGELNLDSNEIILKDEVEGRLIVDGKSFKITTDSLRGNLLGKSILSEEEVLFETKGLKIVSSTMEITQKAQEGVKVLFWKANLNQVNSDSEILKGKANKIELFLSKDLMVMEGNAVFHEDNMKIISDELHYDLNKDRILKSVNAQIINNL